MEDGIYQMSTAENLLVLIIIGLWIFAVINLVRKLEHIWNPPSSYPVYSTDRKRNSNSHESVIPMRLSIRATSEPTIDASPRTTILVRSPSETFVQTRSSASNDTLPSSSGNFDTTICRIQTEFLYPKRLPSIVRRSLLDLHRRTLRPITWKIIFICFIYSLSK